MRTLRWTVCVMAFLTVGSALVLAAGKDPPNTLTAAEKKAGWKLLFDGKSTTGWRGFNQQAFPEKGWDVKDGTIGRVREPDEKKGPGDIITVDEFDNYELKLEYRITPGGNSGIKYLVDESMVKGGGKSGLGFEFQILDDAGEQKEASAGGGKHSCGALYDLIPPKERKLNPAGEWNELKLVINGTHIEHWVNGSMTVQYERASPELKAMIAQSKYKGIPGFGENAKGHILLQDHPGEVRFRNIKLRPLPQGKKKS